MSLASVAKQTLDIVKRGEYQSKNGLTIRFKAQIDEAISGTRLYTPEQLSPLLEARQTRKHQPGQPVRPPQIEVTPESTAQAARRLYELEGEQEVVALNFASAKNPGGGFLGGAKAQEEDLARCSALYNCQLTQREYYEANRSYDSLLYTDHIIYSPKVPFFRDEKLDLLDQPFLSSIITAPAPNAGEFLKREPQALEALHSSLKRRAGMVLAVAADQGQRILVLGAWGCGVFRNTPVQVAQVFAEWLTHPGFAGAFDRVVFGICERDKNRPILQVFQQKLLA
jgi:uncharacterized protein (TIGR02452 family)